MVKPPTGCRIKGGRYYRVQYIGQVNGKTKYKWHPLTRVTEGLPALYKALSELGSPGRESHAMPARIQLWLQHALPGLSATEQKELARKGGIVAEVFTEFDTSQVQAKHVLTFLKQWTDKGSLRMAQSYRSMLNQFFKWVIVQGDRQDNPVEPVSTKPPPPNMRDMTDTAFKLIRAKLMGDSAYPAESGAMMQCCVDLLYLTGQSGMDIRMMRWAQIDEAKGLIPFARSKVAKKTGAKVDFPITPAIARVLERAKALMIAKGRLSPYVIHSLTGAAYGAHAISTAWDRARRRAFAERPEMPELLKFTTKDLRAKHATDAKRQGYTTEQIGDGLAHANESMTTVYLKQRMSKRASVELEIPD
ncbi:MAG: tyrosine-type recombinase/integrase [Burkholderiales bacterium]